MRSRFAKVVLAVAAVLCVAAPASARNGMLGIFFDQYGSQCAGTIRQGGVGQMYVVFLPAGDTRDGITGVEFSIEMQDASGYNVLATQPLLLTGLGDAFAGGVNIVNGECLTNLAIPVLSIQVQNLSGGSNAKFVVRVHGNPSVKGLPCALVTLCDAPAYTAMCVETGKAVINPTGSTTCGSNSESAEWSRIKELYR